MIQELIDKALVRKDRVRSGKYSPSSLGRCYRNQYWNRKNETPSNPPDERTQRIFRVGDLFHEFIEDIIIANNPDTQKEVLVETEDFKGYADLVTNEEVIDIKSQHSKAFHYRNGLVWKDLEPKLYCNILQVIFYATQLKKPKARLCFVSKDDLCIQEYSLFTEDKWQEELDREVDILKKIWEKQILPAAHPRAYLGQDGKPRECTYCQFLDKCKEKNLK